MRRADRGTRGITTLLWVGLAIVVGLFGLRFRNAGHASRGAAPAGTPAQPAARPAQADPGSSSPHSRPKTVRNG